MVLLTVMLTAAFVMVSAEYRTTTSSFGATRALNFAQAGLERYVAEAHNLSAGYDSTHYTFSGGYARVVARRLRDSTASTNQLWVIYSTGVDTSRQLVVQGGGGQRVVSQLATLDPGQLPYRAAIVAPNGVQMQGPSSGTASTTSNPIRGTDFGFITPGCNTSARHDTTALTVAAGDYAGGSPNPTTGPRHMPIEYLASSSAVLDSTRIDWARLVNGEFTPDFVGTLPPSGNSTYQTHYYTGNVTIPAGSRRGFLVSRGNVTLASGAHWDGIILAGGRLDANGNFNFTVHGMIITGMNMALGDPVPANQVRRGSGRVLQWDYCYATSSISSLGFLIPIRGSMTDAWGGY